MIKDYQYKRVNDNQGGTVSASLPDMCLPYIFLTDGVLKTATDPITDALSDPKKVVEPDHPP